MAETEVDKTAVIRSLSLMGPLDPETIRMLELPQTLFDLGLKSGPSFSSHPSMPASTLEGCFFVGLPLPKTVPGYAIAVSLRGDSLFCTLVDKKRRIIVNAPLRKLVEGGADWEELRIRIGSAIRTAGEQASKGKKFSFVLAGEETTAV